ncbi:MAG TPA: 2-amino-4-hydroxy-6-hydroxymethyldihydropteridine diphosphokinase, partial [Aggregatilineales bacterium]|nr:2-amino-4-hydroxy-6-hydroxymethyldihydropteridine diphosphokinase [Aggregatilineales bacterium]
IGIGANLGDARASVEQAIQELGALPATRLTGQSSLFRTAPIDAGGDDYINAVARIETQLQAEKLLQKLQAMEQASGRERPFVNAPRTLDLDILLYGSQEISTESLNVPHPRLTQRAFALIPLLQIDPMIAIPGKGPAHSFVPSVAGQVICKV